MKLKENLFELNVLKEIKLMYMPNTCRLVWKKDYMLSEISVKCLGPAENSRSSRN
jgi:hypothetical protein